MTPISSLENTAEKNTFQSSNSTSVAEHETPSSQINHHKKNIYPSTRHVLLITFILFGLCLILFLIHQNGKSIYDNGI